MLNKKKLLMIIGIFGIITFIIIAGVIFFNINTPKAGKKENKTENEEKIGNPPGSFLLSSNASNPDTDGTFGLFWTTSSFANSYTVYSYSGWITEINSSLTIEGTTTNTNWMISSKASGTTYYFAVGAKNIVGTTLSNNTLVNVQWKGWTWVSGNNTANVNGNYGTKGIPNANNYPGGRNEAVSSEDILGNMWLFGGTSGGTSFFNDLWVFNITTNVWTWVSGNNTVNVHGKYGTKGFPNATNYPGSRHGSTSWTDLQGNMWLFGGEGYNESGTYGLLNDLWVFNVTTKVWTWISGNKTLNVQGIYGTKGVPNIANYPGSRAGSVSWVGLQGNLWVFGGIGYATGSLIGYLNDLWMFNITTKVWVWVSGNNTRDAYGKYGTKGVPNAANYPGGRQDAMSWADPQKNLWLFGGKGVAGSGGGGYLNDLWMFNVTTKIWVWVSGNNTINAYGKYGTKGVPDVGNYPGAQHLAILWGDVQDNLWLFGGQGYTWFPFGNLNDLLMFNSTTKLWTWILGNQLVDDHGIYGTKGVLDDGIYPCGRSGAVSWKDSQGNFWFFGGFGYPTMISGGYLNDLWKYTF